MSKVLALKAIGSENLVCQNEDGVNMVVCFTTRERANYFMDRLRWNQGEGKGLKLSESCDIFEADSTLLPYEYLNLDGRIVPKTAIHSYH